MRDTPSSIMLFAAGFGTRMGQLTRDTPKPMIRVGGKHLVDHAIKLSRDAGIERLVANVHYLPEGIVPHLVANDVAISHEVDEILETGGGLRLAMPLLGDGPVFTSNTDAVWTGRNPFTNLLERWDGSRMDALLLLVPPENATGHKGAGDFSLDESGQIARGPGYVYSGVQIIKTDLLHQIPDRKFSLNLVWDMMISQGRAFGAVHDGGWCDVGSPAGIELAEELLEVGRDV